MVNAAIRPRRVVVEFKIPLVIERPVATRALRSVPAEQDFFHLFPTHSGALRLIDPQARFQEGNGFPPSVGSPRGRCGVFYPIEREQALPALGLPVTAAVIRKKAFLLKAANNDFMGSVPYVDADPLAAEMLGGDRGRCATAERVEDYIAFPR